MTKIALEYQRYRKFSVMKRLAILAHGDSYTGQTSSATYEEICSQIRLMDLPANSVILDAGCGNGAFSIPLAVDFPFQIKGVDLEKESIQEATTRALNANLSSSCQFSVDDFSFLPHFSDVSFDLILCVGSLYWGQRLDVVFNQWRLLSRKNSYLLLFLNLSYASLTTQQQKNVGETQFLSKEDMQEALERQGWSILEWKDGTDVYIKWLRRWCSAMNSMYYELVEEMGSLAATQLVCRFNTYLELAEKNIVKRVIIRGNHA